MNRISSLLGTGWKRNLAIAGICLIAMLLAFQGGVLVGIRKAEFSFGSGARFYRQVMIGDRDDNGPFGMPIDDFSASHGVAGKIVSVSLPYVVIASPNNMEKTAVIASSTTIRLFQGAGSPGDIRSGEYVVVLGEPDQSGRIDARFIRIAPSLPGTTTGAMTGGAQTR